MTRDRHAKPAECFEFIWRRREKGPAFRWQQDESGRWLLLGPLQERLLPYEPLAQETGLFLTFAHLDGSKDEFLRFANTYGRLGTYHAYGPEHGEPLDEWQQHHRWMRFLADLRRESTKDRPELDNFVRWKGDEVIYRFPKIGTSATASLSHGGELRQRPQSKQGLPLIQPGDFIQSTSWFLGYALNDWLTVIRHYAPIEFRFVWSEEDSRPRLVFGPSTLLGAMVCQFAAALHGAWPFQECACCHKLFRLSPGINRANRITCSSTCKQYLHNRRVGRARQLHAQGRSIRQIVKELNVKPHGNKSNVEIVKTWVRMPAASNSASPEQVDTNSRPRRRRFRDR